jgi:hypothetical protein
MHDRTHTTREKIVVGMLISMLLISGFALPNPRPAEAQFAVIDASNLAQTTISAVASGVIQAATSLTSQLTNALVIKEYVLDSIAYSLAKQLIRSLSTSIIRWANSGFQGNPSFITDFRGFLTDTADQAFGFFLEDLGLAGLCSYLRQPLIRGIRLRFQEPFRRRAACTLSELTRTIRTIDANGIISIQTVSVNAEDFVSGNWYAGGWDGWYTLVTQPQNNPYGLYLAAADEGERRAAAAVDARRNEATWNRGFLSFENCSTVSDIEGNAFQSCQIVTPGALIEEQVNLALGSPLRQLEMADEINEVIAAIAVNLINEVLTGAQGLLGLTQPRQSGVSGGTSYLDQYQTGDLFVGTSQQDLVSNIEAITQTENTFRAALQPALFSVSTTEQELISVSSCYAQKIQSGILNPFDVALASERITGIASTISTQITPPRQNLSQQISTTDRNLITLANLRARALQATNPQDVAGTSLTLQELVTNNVFHTDVDVRVASNLRDSTLSSMNSLRQSAAQQLAECNAFPSQP